MSPAPQNLSTTHRVYIGLGSNLSNDSGDPRQILRQAIDVLHALATDTVQVSGLYLSKPMGPQDQPDYWNAAASFETTLGAHDLLKALHHIEQQAGRVRLRRWGERTLDLDILFYAEQCIDTPELTIPHVGILQRDFVVMPLLELNDELQIGEILLRECPVAQQAEGICRIADSSWANVC